MKLHDPLSQLNWNDTLKVIGSADSVYIKGNELYKAARRPGAAEKAVDVASYIARWHNNPEIKIGDKHISLYQVSGSLHNITSGGQSPQAIQNSMLKSSVSHIAFGLALTALAAPSLMPDTVKASLPSLAGVAADNAAFMAANKNMPPVASKLMAISAAIATEETARKLVEAASDLPSVVSKVRSFISGGDTITQDSVRSGVSRHHDTTDTPSLK